MFGKRDFRTSRGSWGREPQRSWFAKILPWPPGSPAREESPPDRRHAFRLNLKNFHPLEAKLRLKNGTVVNILIRDLSAGGMCCQVAEPIQAAKGDRLTAMFILPLEQPFVLKTEARVVTRALNGRPDPKILRLKFSESLSESSRDLIHRFIITKQF
ncbi:MAG: PilZ domain-containing protein, partial [Nitrospinaceae bacterium]|nr:PilZ domain-containing protein [Nitrospinaceae bacterium]